MSVWDDIQIEVRRQDEVHSASFTPPTRDNVRLGIAAIEDELAETWEAWHREKRTGEWVNTAEECLQVVGNAIRLYRDITRERK